MEVNRRTAKFQENDAVEVQFLHVVIKVLKGRTATRRYGGPPVPRPGCPVMGESSSSRRGERRRPRRQARPPETGRYDLRIGRSSQL